MNVLIVEDAPVRVGRLRQLVPLAHIWEASRGKQAIEILTQHPIGLIFLDYDLIGGLTGLDVAQTIHQLRPLPTVIIHSMNIAGAVRIQRVLPEAIPCPIRDIEKRWKDIAAKLVREDEPG